MNGSEAGLPHTPLLLGHRGARLYAPENTFAAFDLALAHGCDGFEFDVRLTGDSVAVVCHDANIGGSVVATSTWAQLQELSEVPTLEQVLARYAASSVAPVVAPVMDIELKVEGLESLALDALRRHPPQRKYWVSSFLPQVLVRMRQLDAQVPLGLICDRADQLACWPTLPASALFLHSRLLTPCAPPRPARRRQTSIRLDHQPRPPHEYPGGARSGWHPLRRYPTARPNFALSGPAMLLALRIQSQMCSISAPPPEPPWIPRRLASSAAPGSARTGALAAPPARPASSSPADKSRLRPT